MKLFIDNNTDVAENLRQEFVRIKKNREEDRTSIVVGRYSCGYCIADLVMGETRTLTGEGRGGVHSALPFLLKLKSPTNIRYS